MSKNYNLHFELEDFLDKGKENSIKFMDKWGKNFLKNIRIDLFKGYIYLCPPNETKGEINDCQLSIDDYKLISIDKFLEKEIDVSQNLKEKQELISLQKTLKKHIKKIDKNLKKLEENDR